MNLQPWRKSGMLTWTRTVGQIGLRKNGGDLDIWIRVEGQPRWFALQLADVRRFLHSDEHDVVLQASSDGNAEDPWRSVLKGLTFYCPDIVAGDVIRTELLGDTLKIWRNAVLVYEGPP